MVCENLTPYRGLRKKHNIVVCENDTIHWSAKKTRYYSLRKYIDRMKYTCYVFMTIIIIIFDIFVQNNRSVPLCGDCVGVYRIVHTKF
jgi:hypothetical protein